MIKKTLTVLAFSLISTSALAMSEGDIKRIGFVAGMEAQIAMRCDEPVSLKSSVQSLALQARAENDAAFQNGFYDADVLWLDAKDINKFCAVNRKMLKAKKLID